MKKSQKSSLMLGMFALFAGMEENLPSPNFGQIILRRNGTLRNKTDDFDGITIGTYSNTQTAFYFENYRIYALNRRNADRKLAAYKRQNNITD